MHIESQKSLSVIKKIVDESRGINRFEEKRKDLSYYCPIIEKIV
jgi:hypothetical protein